MLLVWLWGIPLMMGAQNANGPDYKAGKSWGIQMDAFDFLAQGFSLWLQGTFNYNRVFLDGGINELPDFLNPQSADFRERRQYFIQGGYYRFLKKPNGLFIGGEIIFQQMEISSKTSNETLQNQVLRAGPVIGFEWLPIKSWSRFSITPWISQRLPLYSPESYFPEAGKHYQTANFNFVMGCNLGIRFPQ